MEERIKIIENALNPKTVNTCARLRRETVKNALKDKRASYLNVDQINKIIKDHVEEGKSHCLIDINKVRYDEICQFLDKGYKVTSKVTKNCGKLFGCFSSGFLEEFIKISWK
jgi:hypothetical protein